MSAYVCSSYSRISDEQDPWFVKQLEIFIQEVNQVLQQEAWKTEFEEFIHNHAAFFAGDSSSFADGHYEVWESFKKFTGIYYDAGSMHAHC